MLESGGGELANESGKSNSSIVDHIIPRRPTTRTDELGTTYTVGKTDIRIMNGGRVHSPRPATTRAESGRDYVRSSG